MELPKSSHSRAICGYVSLGKGPYRSRNRRRLVVDFRSDRAWVDYCSATLVSGLHFSFCNRPAHLYHIFFHVAFGTAAAPDTLNYNLCLSFAYRGVFVFVDEAKRIERAKAARCVDTEANGLRLRATARTIGMVFIRAYERGERTYRSMVARGFEDNTFDTLSVHKRDVILGCSFVAGVIVFTGILG